MFLAILDIGFPKHIFALFDEQWKHSAIFALFLNGC